MQTWSRRSSPQSAESETTLLMDWRSLLCLKALLPQFNIQMLVHFEGINNTICAVALNAVWWKSFLLAFHSIDSRKLLGLKMNSFLMHRYFTKVSLMWPHFNAYFFPHILTAIPGCHATRGCRCVVSVWVQENRTEIQYCTAQNAKTLFFYSLLV